MNEITNVIIWGAHIGFPDTVFASAEFSSGIKTYVAEHENDNNWLNNDLVKIVQERTAIVQELMEKAVCHVSTAKAIANQMKDWWCGTNEGEWTSMGVMSDGSYGIPQNIFFSFPVIIKDKQYKIVQVSYQLKYANDIIYIDTHISYVFCYLWILMRNIKVSVYMYISFYILIICLYTVLYILLFNILLVELVLLKINMITFMDIRKYNNNKECFLQFSGSPYQ